MKLQQKVVGYITQTFGACILSLILIKVLYALKLAGGLCWTTDCETVSIVDILIFYFLLTIVNLYLFIIPKNAESTFFQINTLVATLIIQIFASLSNDNFAFSSIFFGLAGIVNYILYTKNSTLKLWESLLASILMLLIAGLIYLNLTDILIGYLGIQHNPENELIIELIINAFIIGLVLCLFGLTITRIKNNCAFIKK